MASVKQGFNPISFINKYTYYSKDWVGVYHINFSYRTLHCVPLSITAVKNIFPLDISFNSIYSSTNNKSTYIS